MDRRRLLGAMLAGSAALLGQPSMAFAQTPAKAPPAPPKPGKPKGPPSLYPLDGYGPRATDHVVLRWNEQALSAIRAVKPAPTVVARALAVVQTCVFDAWAAYDPVAVGTRLGGSLRRPAVEHTSVYKSAATSYAAYRALSNLFPSRKADFDGLMLVMGYDPALASTDVTTPQGVGTVAADAVLEFCRADGANQAGGYRDTSGYVPVNTPDTVVDRLCWQPLRYSDGAGGTLVQTFATPHWGQVVPFALTRPDQFPCPGPTLTKEQEYKKAIKALVEETAKLDDRQKVVAEYWADGPASELPPGHWNVFAQAVSRMRGHSLDQDVRLLFALDGAMLDASIAAWHAKRKWDFVRPVTAIREEYRGKKISGWRGPYLGNGTIFGETWRPYQPDTFPTPPFPDYVSGHSTFSAAGAQVLRTFTGSDALNVSVTIPAGTGRVEPGSVPTTDLRLAWASYTAAADEAGMSRRWGSIHFDDADLHARTMGRSIGTNAYNHAQAFINGSV